MSTTVNEAIKQCIHNVMLLPEMSSEFKRAKTISVKKLFEAEKRRYARKTEFLNPILEELQKSIPDVKEILYVESNINEAEFVLLTDDISSSLCVCWSRSNIRLESSSDLNFSKEEILHENEGLFKKIAMYGIINNYTVVPYINTISNNFEVILGDTVSTISFSNSILDNLGKCFSLSYIPYLQENNERDVIRVGKEYYNLETNILGLKSQFTKPFEADANEETNPILRFIENLQVYKDDISQYLLHEIENG